MPGESLHRPFRISLPAKRVGCDIVPDPVEFCLVPDDVFKIVVLPEPPSERGPAELADASDIAVGGKRLKRANDLAEPLSSALVLDHNDAMEMVRHHHER